MEIQPHGKPAIVPIIDREEYLRLLVEPAEGTRDLVIVHDAEDELGHLSSQQAGMPIRPTRESADYRSMTEEGAMEALGTAINHIRKLVEKNEYRRIIFLADPPFYPGDDPEFARGGLGLDVQLFITDLIYDLGAYIKCVY